MRTNVIVNLNILQDFGFAKAKQLNSLPVDIVNVHNSKSVNVKCDADTTQKQNHMMNKSQISSKAKNVNKDHIHGQDYYIQQIRVVNRSQ